MTAALGILSEILKSKISDSETSLHFFYFYFFFELVNTHATTHTTKSLTSTTKD